MKTPDALAADVIGRGKGRRFGSASELRTALAKAIAERDKEWLARQARAIEFTVRQIDQAREIISSGADLPVPTTPGRTS